MASFTDIIPQFNPYVQQLPVEAMVQVGMEKQKRYDEGIQKIQQSIDTIAGLDVARDVDKAYLQSKLNELGNNLMFVAAGDFSNFQLVNSVDGMAKQLAYDPNVQSAVSSTAWYRKQKTEMEKAISEGKSSQSNIYDFNEQANRWMSSDKVGENFKGRYTQYTDVKKKAIEAIKALHPNLQKYDIPFEVDGNGKINISKIADVMQRYKIEGIDENQIEQAIRATMTPDDLNQLRIDAKYEFRGAGVDQLVAKANTDYTNRRTQVVESLALLETQKKTTTDPTKLTQIDDRISMYKELLGGDGKPGILAEQLAKNIELATTNPDEVKYSIYKNGFIQEFANAFKWQSQEMEYVKNPIREQMNWVAEQRLRVQKENRERYEFSVTSAQKERELALKAEENALKNIELYGVDSPWTMMGNETDNKQRGQEYFSKHSVSVGDSIDSNKQALRNKGYSEAEINNMINRWNESGGVNSKANIPANAIKLVRQIVKDDNYLAQLKAFETKTRTEAEKDAGVKDIIDNSLKGKTGITVTTKDGRKITLSAKEIIGLKLATSETEVPTEYGTTKREEVDVRKLNANQKAFYKAVYGSIPGEPPSTRMSDNNIQKVNQLLAVYDKDLSKIRQAYDKADKLYKEKLGEAANAFVPQIKAVANPKGEVPPMALQGLNQLIIAQQAKGIKTDKNWDFETASSYLTADNVKDTRVIVKQDGDSYEIQLRNLKDPDNVQTFKVSETEVINYLGDKYTNPNVRESARFAIGGGKSDILGTNVPTNALLQKRFGNFPGIKKLQVTANLIEDTPGLFIPKVYLKNKQGNYIGFELSGSDGLSRVGYQQGVDNLDALTDDVLLKVLKQEYPNFDFSTIDY